MGFIDNLCGDPYCGVKFMCRKCRKRLPGKAWLFDQNRKKHGGGNHKGGFGEPMSGFDNQGNSLTASLGYGSREGETLLGDGTDKVGNEFLQSENHNHYGSGAGANDNVKDRGKYHGSGW